MVLQDLQKLMDNAKDGVIYFSMGSNLKSKDMPAAMKREFLEIFGQLKQTVIWKFEEALPDAPKNVHMMTWAPQQSILAHPNCVLFVTHGGLLSSTETVHFGVPIIGIPVFGDQFVNVGRAVNKGIAVKVDLSYDTPKELKLAIQEVLSNPSYRETVKYLSLVYHDRPVPPSKELVHWVEHAIKTRGAPHLRSRALMTPWYQKMYLDLAALVLIVLFSLSQKVNRRRYSTIRNFGRSTQGRPTFYGAKIRNALKKFHPRKAPGIDGFTTDIGQAAIFRDVGLFLAMANKCLEEDFTRPKSYRPIGVLPVLGKTVESMMVGRLQWHLMPKLQAKQYGFILQCGTSHALLGSQNKLRFAPSKTNSIVLTKKLKYDDPVVHINCEQISLVDEICLLGLTIDKKLTFIPHVAKACKKAANIYKGLARAVKATWGLSQEVVRTIYITVIESVILYASCI
ncbi:UDP-glucuronosyltransferase [Eumeta japonica]|uniref:UDP-glucuronosyltransferase n=1 Tax=Eumeta variegata TaxID=151549 RepID=A0A4C1TL60_EUMVA|nr:UDP-glucuronosyltransferase [Eumeta japonica]